MRLVVIGLGSMGKRRIRLLNHIDPSIQIVGVDSAAERQAEAKEKFSIEVASSLDTIDGRIDGALVCTSPLSHSKIIHQCLLKGWNVFTEINLVPDMYDENIALAKQNHLALFLSSTFLYREEVQYIKKLVAQSECRLNYSYHIGQYLPDWHPWESYKSFFVSDKRTNGCREILSIELPWLFDVFGNVQSFYVMKDHMSTLDLDYADNYMIMLKHQNGAKGCLLVDVVSRKAVRNFEVFGEKLFLTWNGAPEGVRQYHYDSKTEENVQFDTSAERCKGYSEFIVENAYQKELEEFLSQVTDGKLPRYSFEKDKNILDCIQQIENDHILHMEKEV